MQKSFPATLDNLKNIRLFLINFLKDHKIENKIIKEVELAVDEAASNIIKHAYIEENKNNVIKIELELKNRTFLIQLYDNGIEVDKNTIKPRSLDNVKPGGLGSHFINQIMDETKYLKSNKWINHLVMKKNIN
jgi:anti-sigma regulatory factor (Ser/Thr protein kinase)|tara:strand:- start:493 stop:891 length:399 start_codon:yes stop_codon:yes gene_type:complete